MSRTKPNRRTRIQPSLAAQPATTGYGSESSLRAEDRGKGEREMRLVTFATALMLLLVAGCSSGSSSKPASSAAPTAAASARNVDCSAAEPSADAQASIAPAASGATRVTSTVQSVMPDGLTLA